MSSKPVRSWAELWTLGSNAGCTHWNYSHGKIRFRGKFEEPEEIGEECELGDSAPIRVRFYTVVDDEYVEKEDLDCWFQPTKIDPLFSEDFERLDPKNQKDHISVAIQRISASRFAKQMDSAEKLTSRFIEHLQREIDKKDKLIASLTERNNELLASRGINNVWEFLVHPNSERVIAALSLGIANNRPKLEQLVSELQKLQPQPSNSSEPQASNNNINLQDSNQDKKR